MHVVGLLLGLLASSELLLVASAHGTSASSCVLAGLILASVQLGLMCLLVRQQRAVRRARTSRRRCDQAQHLADLALDEWVSREASRGIEEMQRWLTDDRQ